MLWVIYRVTFAMIKLWWQYVLCEFFLMVCGVVYFWLKMFDYFVSVFRLA